MSFIKKYRTYQGFIIAIVLFLIIITFITVRPRLIDSFLLQEDRYPLVNTVLEEAKEVYLGVPESLMLELDGREWMNRENLLLSYGLADYDGFGVSFQKEADTLTFSGTANQNIWVGLTYEPIRLDNGLYYISVGEEVPEISCYLEGIKKDGNEVLAKDLGEEFFYITDSDEYSDGYRLTVFISEGQNVDNIELVPRLIKLGDISGKDEFIEVTLMTGVGADTWSDLSEDEKKVILNNMYYQSRECEGVFIIFDDGTGMRVK